MDVGTWLRGLGLGRYEQAFRDGDIDAEVLPELTAEDLLGLGIASIGHRRKLLAAIAALRKHTSPSFSAGAVSAAIPTPASASSQAERRQLTVMFCDLVGSTLLASRLDPEDLRDVIGAYHLCVADAVSRYDGFVAKYMGDGVLVYFGWPRAHENEAEQAVRAGLAVIEAVAQQRTPQGEVLACRIGIATGQVVVGDLIGEGAAQEQAVVGETPNLAARLQVLAGPNEVVIGPGTQRLVSGLFDLADLGTNEFKGFGEKVRAWRVRSESRVESRFAARSATGLTPLIGRLHELGMLLDRFERAKDGEGQVVLLSGEPGIGKSRLAHALLERLAGEPHTRLRYYCSPYHANSALHPIIAQLERAAAFEPDDQPKQRLDKLETLLCQATNDVVNVTPLFAALLSIPIATRYAPLNLPAQRQRELTIGALLDQLSGLAARQPVVMVLEDGQWLDPTSTELFERLIECVQTLPVLLLITFRPEFAPPWTSYPHMTSLTLNRLGRRHSTEMIAAVGGGKPLPATISEQIWAKTEGVPLFVEELTKTVLEGSFLRETEGAYELAGPLPPLAIPATLQDSLMARLDRFAPVKEVAQIGAVIGREFSYRLLAALSPPDETALQEALSQLVGSELVFRRGTIPDATYSFKHTFVQETAYHSLLKSKRQQLHAQIAKVLEGRFSKVVETEPEVLARHYTEAGSAASAIQYWLRAAQRASERSAHRETIAHCGKGLALIAQLPETPERDGLELELRLALGPAMMVVKGFAAQEVGENYARARELCETVGQPPQMFAVLYGLWINEMSKSQLDGALALATELLAVAREQSDTALLLQAHHAHWTTFFYRGNLKSCLEHARKGIELYDVGKHSHHAFIYGGHDPGVCCRGVAAESLWYIGYPDQALQSADDAVRLARQLDHPFSELQALLSQAPVHFQRCDIEATRRDAEAGTRLCADHDIAPHYAADFRAFGGWAVARAGEINEGIGQISQGIETYRTSGSARRMLHLFALSGDACLHAGRSDEGLAAVAEGLAYAEESGERIGVPELLCLKGQLLRSGSARDAGGAQSCFERAIEVARGLDAKMLELRAATSLARMWAERGERQQAHDLLAPIYGWFTEGFETADLKDAKALLDELCW